MKEALDVPKAECLFLFSTFVTFITMASTTSEQGQPSLLTQDNREGIPEWIFLQTGTHYLTMFLVHHRPEMSRGRLGFIWQDGVNRMQRRETETERYNSRNQSVQGSSPEDDTTTAVGPQEDVHYYLDTVRDQIEKGVPDEKLRTAYTKAIDGLHQSFHVSAASVRDDYTDAFMWMFIVREDITPLLMAPLGPKQEALVLMAFFAALLRRINGNWWGKGCGEMLMGRAWAMLDEEHRPWARWPVEEMGWIPG